MKNFIPALLAAGLLLTASAPAQNVDPLTGPGLDMSKDYYAVLETTEGNILLELRPDVAPNAVQNFVNLIEGTKVWKDPETGRMMEGEPFYDGLTFHRIVPGFMIQGGDPLGTGRGGPGYTFDDELSSELSFAEDPYLLAYANRGPNTNGSQFFITVKGSFPSYLDTQYSFTKFGQAIGGRDVVDEIVSGPRQGDKATDPAVIEDGWVIRLADGAEIDTANFMKYEGQAGPESAASEEATRAEEPAATE